MKVKRIKILKFITTGFLIWLFAYTVEAQEYQYVPFPDSNAVWSVVFAELDPETNWLEQKYTYNKYALFNEDTVVSGIKYHKLFHSHTANILPHNSICIGGIREDSFKRVWFNKWNKTVAEKNHINENDELLLYDFSISHGDTLWKDRSHIFMPGNPYLTLRDIDTININSSLRKVFIFNELYNPSWIEGIGNTMGLITMMDDFLSEGMVRILICMHQDDTLLYYNDRYGSCIPQFVLNGLPFIYDSEIKIYPNPASGGAVCFESFDCETFELYDPRGQLVMEKNIKGQHSLNLDISEFKAGVYLYRFTKKGMVTSPGKLIIQ